MAKRKPTKLEMSFLLAFHALLSGAFFVSYFTSDEDTYGMHVFSGYTVAAVLAVRLAIGLFAPAGSPLRLPRPSWTALRQYAGRLLAFDRQALAQRSPLYAWMAAILLAVLVTAATTGIAADFLTSVEELHESIGEASLFLVIGHIGLVFVLHGLNRLAPGRKPVPANESASSNV